MNAPKDSSLGCIVIGGSGQLGQSVVRTLHAAGAKVGFTYFENAEASSQLNADLESTFSSKADVRDLDELQSAIDSLAMQLPRIDAIVHCVSVCLTPGDSVPEDRSQRLSDVSGAGWDDLMSVNLRSAYFACQAVVPRMVEAGGGNIVLVGSISGTRPLPSPVHYATSKTALEGMARSMAKELGSDNIRVNVIETGILEAGISRTLPDNLIREYEKHCSLRRVGRMDEIAIVVSWMALQNTYVSGQAIMVDGAL